MPVEVLCIGHATHDLSLFVDGFPREDSKAEVHDLIESGGGPAANAAYLLSMWGVGCAFAGLVGDDPRGRQLRDDLVAGGTDCSMLELRPGHPTPFSVILINRQSGSRTIVNRKARGGELMLESRSLSRWSPKVLLFDGHELSASLAALDAFPDASSILDAGSWREGTAALAGRVDYLAASRRFALQATELAHLDDDSARRRCVSRLRDRYATAVVVTLGEQGVVADDGSGFRHLRAFPAQAVDTTAAGDIFHGALAYAVAQGMSFNTALRFASMAASLSVRVRGGRDSIPTLARVKEALVDAD